jgi:hypothetical protein
MMGLEFTKALCAGCLWNDQSRCDRKDFSDKIPMSAITHYGKKSSKDKRHKTGSSGEFSPTISQALETVVTYRQTYSLKRFKYLQKAGSQQLRPPESAMLTFTWLEAGGQTSTLGNSPTNRLLRILPDTTLPACLY